MYQQNYPQQNQQVHPQVQPQTGFNNPTEVVSPKPNIIFDNETKEILNQTYNEMINGMINLAIKRFAETKEYKEYFVKKEFRELVIVKEEFEETTPDFNETSSTSNSTQVHSTPGNNLNNLNNSNSAISAVSAW